MVSEWFHSHVTFRVHLKTREPISKVEIQRDRVTVHSFRRKNTDKHKQINFHENQIRC